MKEVERPRDEVAPPICAKNFGRHRRHCRMVIACAKDYFWNNTIISIIRRWCSCLWNLPL